MREFIFMCNSEFISKWNINGTLYLPLIESGTYDFSVDWGDDSPIQDITSYDNANHSYSTSGVYTIRISGTIKGWRAKDNNSFQLLDIWQWGCLKLGNEGEYFDCCKKLQITANDAPDLSETTNLESMFSNCKEFNSSIDHWDVSNVTNMRYMFHCAEKFNQSLNSWNVSNVTSMENMFCFTESFNQPLDLWDVSHVTDMEEMFSFSSFNQPLDSWDVSNVIYMKKMFYIANSFNQPLDTWNVSNVISMEQMFAIAHEFNQPLYSWNVSNVKNMESMFDNASAFNQDISMWNVSQVTNMNSMLEGTSLDYTNRSELLLNWERLHEYIVKHIYGKNKGLNCLTPSPLLDSTEF
jgi:surface protein